MSEFEDLFRAFRPQFDNPIHIQLAQDLAAINIMGKQIEKKRADAADVKKLERELTRLKKNAIYLLKK